MSRTRILVVEDNPLNLKLVRDVLGAAGYDVVSATTGEDGLREAAQNPPALVLMDLHLPGIDGTETMRRLRRDTLDPAVPIIAVTASAMTEDQERLRRAGFDDYLEKPISVRGLVDRVAALLPDGGS